MGRMDLQTVVYDLISKYELCKRERESSSTLTCLGIVSFCPEGDDGVKVIAIESGPVPPAIPLSERPLSPPEVTVGNGGGVVGGGLNGKGILKGGGTCECQ